MEVYENTLKNDIELMQELVKELPQTENSDAAGIDSNIALEPLQGAALRALRKLLEEKDPQQHWGGLQKVLTPEGHYLWLCEDHAKQFSLTEGSVPVPQTLMLEKT
jgi:hypothetical protein